jgi:hypothetical protein
MDLVVKENFVLHERRISLSEFHAADEVWYFLKPCLNALELIVSRCRRGRAWPRCVLLLPQMPPWPLLLQVRMPLQHMLLLPQKLPWPLPLRAQSAWAWVLSPHPCRNSQPLPPGLLRYDGAPSVPLSLNDSVTAYFTLVTTIATQVCRRCSGVLRSRHFT